MPVISSEQKNYFQIVGHKDISDNGSTFDEDFHKWFGDHKKQFAHLIEID